MTSIQSSDIILTAFVQLHHFTWIAGAHDKASVKQIMHMSSASCLRVGLDEQPWRHGKHTTSPLMPPHIWPQGCSLLQALRACSCFKEKGIESVRLQYVM